MGLTASALPDPNFWAGKKALLTGHTGFKGSWLAYWLSGMGAEVVGLSLTPATEPNLCTLLELGSLIDSRVADIRDLDTVVQVVKETRPDIIFHLAAQALVRAGYKNPSETFTTNIIGSANVLDAVRQTDRTRVVVMVTTDKVYQNLEHPYPYRESDRLGGHDPYSASKAAAEIVIACYRQAFLAESGVAVASARAGNVVGGGDWSADRLIPDAIRAWIGGNKLHIRRPQAIRPWQHVLEPLTGYSVLAERLWQDETLSGAYNFGPETQEAATVREMIEIAATHFENAQVAWGDGTEGPHEAGWLSLEIAKSRNRLNVLPRWNLEATITRTVDWYRRQANGAAARKLCDEDIAAYRNPVATGHNG